MGQRIFLLDPWDIAAGRLGTKPSCFNPLDWIMVDDPDTAENAFLLADALVPAETRGDGASRFWDDEAKALQSRSILWHLPRSREGGLYGHFGTTMCIR